MEHGTSIDILRCRAQYFIRLCKVGDLAEDVWELLQCGQYVRNALLLHGLDCLIGVVYIAVTLSELIQNFLHRGSPSTIVPLTVLARGAWFAIPPTTLFWILSLHAVSTRHFKGRLPHGAPGGTSITGSRSTSVNHTPWGGHNISSISQEVVFLGLTLSHLTLSSGCSLVLEILSTRIWAWWRILHRLARWNAASSHILFLFCTYKLYAWPKSGLFKKLTVFDF